ncbi:D-Ala-D-Ala carboxypeptidase family metallohydrolase [Paenibacillus sp. LHD-117]|uniref:D-Ala-D-Ala carboxypeptidase family metallohydrolase n=1 Tax=Paenibacillus sp. LHD-117 TaxID=3071412 RepID=UPI0027E09D03|nr:D-Ala-D-Ala carboxypeptidase family metallohydrolase [Paenibacillus sp. LHD-117]MDQ6422212.1 D-Ala-D-Ala carboxypeptidase family metallohydrolase [Paenibacillus sp. LHD-117]
MCLKPLVKHGTVFLISAVLGIAFFFFSQDSVHAATTNQTILFSNVGGGTGEVPATSNTVLRTGKNVDGYTMVKVDDLVQILGATFTSESSGNTWKITRNGQIIRFVNGSTSFTTENQYTINYPATSTNKTNTLTWSGTTEKAAQMIDGVRYVRLTAAAFQLGSLVIHYDSASDQVKVFDFRVNSTTPFADSNHYIVGGPWITNWTTSLGTTQLSDNFKVNEVWCTSAYTSGTAYHRQLKFSVNQLQSLENVRFHYNGNSSMSVSSAFRSWKNNSTTDGSWDRSFHMRGRAFDAGGQSLYNSVYNEFKYTSSTPIAVGTSYWRTRVSNGKSGGYEIETMPRDGSYWLHLQRQPGYDTAQFGP